MPPKKDKKPQRPTVKVLKKALPAVKALPESLMVYFDHYGEPIMVYAN